MALRHGDPARLTGRRRRARHSMGHCLDAGIGVQWRRSPEASYRNNLGSALHRSPSPVGADNRGVAGRLRRRMRCRRVALQLVRRNARRDERGHAFELACGGRFDLAVSLLPDFHRLQPAARLLREIPIGQLPLQLLAWIPVCPGAHIDGSQRKRRQPPGLRADAAIGAGRGGAGRALPPLRMSRSGLVGQPALAGTRSGRSLNPAGSSRRARLSPSARDRFG